MNKAYRLIWSKAKERWIVAAEIVKGNGGPPPVTVAAAVLSTVLVFAATGAHALPIGGQVAAGQAAISTPSATQMNITQGTNQAIVNWNSFGIGRGEAVNISQPSASSTLLNRVLGNNPSEIFGSLTANGRVFLTNPSGILFAPGASVNVGGLVASSLNIKDSDFLAGNYSFFKDGTAGSVINQGNISGGFVALLGNSVENAGTIVTTKGSTGFAAGDEITLGFDPAGLMAIKVDKGAYNAQISNSGVIEADGGTVVMTAKAADALLGSVVNNSGVIRAQTMVERNGEIILEGRALIQTGTLTAHSIKADVTNLIDAGQWDASATSNGTVSGGSIAIHATNHIEQTASAVLNANGNATGVGGTIRIEA
ncbi:MAG: filamentous hemagglutinin N-terminal domain-containing protein, partial [Deltaproteobacteria bacterium]|nr:filamentous hemagglutinin N-terminal domain-containing protein [Deltaproteobacteria bacterium]